MIIAVPAVAPPILAVAGGPVVVAPTVALVELLVQVPPLTASDNIVAAAVQTLSLPEIAVGKVYTVTVVVT